jgi:F420H(2)-dependent quinone reductase
MTEHAAYEPSPRERERTQVALYEATDGVEGATLNGSPVIILTHTGAKSGLVRKSPLMRIEHEGSYAIVASNGGGKEPLWARNVAANPVVQLQDGAVKQTIRAREVVDEEKDRSDRLPRDRIDEGASRRRIVDHADHHRSPLADAVNTLVVRELH